MNRISLAWANLTHNKRRTAAALAGVVLAIELMFMQLGFYEGVERSAMQLYDSMPFDAVLVSPQYLFLRNAPAFSRAHAYRAGAVAGVADVEPLYVALATWRPPETRKPSESLLLGLRPGADVFHSADLNARVRLLSRLDTVLVSETTKEWFGMHGVGTVGEANNRRVVAVGTVPGSAGVVAGAIVAASDATYARLLRGVSLDRINVGLVRFDGSRADQAVLEDLQSTLAGGDVEVWSRARLEQQERRFYLRVRPTGFIFTTGLAIGFIVGAAILYQILSAEVARHLDELATLKAVGYSRRALYGVVVEEGILLAVLGYVPAWLIAQIVYFAVRQQANLPAMMTVSTSFRILTLTMMMCVGAALLAARKLGAADPADLF